MLRLRTIGNFQGGVLILPDVRCLGDDELSWIHSYRKSGRTLLITGASGKYDSSGAERTSNPLLKMLGIQNPIERTAGKNFLYRPECPGRAYYAKLRLEFDRAAAADTFDSDEFNQIRKEFVTDLLKVWQPAVEVTASPFVSTQIANVNGKISVFLANFKGLRSKEVAAQIPEKNAKVAFFLELRGNHRVSSLSGLSPESESNVQPRKANGRIAADRKRRRGVDRVET